MKLITTLLASMLCLWNVANANNPTLNCPENITVEAQMGACGQMVTFDVTSAGTCPGETIAQSAGLPSGATFPVGTTTNTFVVTDANGGTDMCSFLVTVLDSQPPAFVCVSDTMVVAPDNTCAAVVTYGLPFISDNCNSDGIILQHNDSDVVEASYTCDSMGVSSHYRVFDVESFGVAGSTQVTSVDVGIGFAPNMAILNVNLYTLEGDVSFNNLTLLASQTVTVPSLFNTLFNVPIIATVPTGSTLVVELVVPEFSSGNTVPGYNVGEGQTAPSYIYSAACGHSDMVSLESIGEPEFSLVLKVNTSNVIVEQTAGLASGESFPIGTTTNTFKVSDSSGNESTCSFNVTVLDQQAPLLVCPSNLEIPADAGACGAVVEFDLFAVENCENETINIVEGLPSGAFFPMGNTLNVFAVVDAGGNVDTCKFDVRIVDMEAPTIFCPMDIVQSVSGNGCFANVEYVINAEDNCTDFTIEQVTGLPSGFSYPVGTVNNVFRVTDMAGNSSTCSFTVTVVDDTLPELVFCPEDMTISADAGTCTAVVNYDAPTFLDDCSIIDYELKHNLSNEVTSSYGCTAGGASSHIRVFDLNSMGVTGALEVDSVQVGIGFADGMPEVGMNLYLLNGELNYANMTLIGSASENIPDIFNGTYTYQIPTAVPAGSILVAELVIPPGTNAPFIAGYNEGGEIRPTYYAAAACNTPEPVTLSSIGISNISLVMNLFAHGEAASTVTQTSGIAAGGAFPMGTTENVYQVMDAAGNVENCSFNITVVDSEGPVLDCMEPITVFTNSITCDTTVAVPAPSFTDNCAGVVSFTNDITNTADATAVYQNGVTLVTWTATDAAGNASTCQMSVEVESGGLSADLSWMDISCFGDTNGTATAISNVGTVDYAWSNGATTETITDLEAGSYIVTLTNASGCMYVGEVLISEPALLLIEDGPSIVNASTGNTDGSIDITVTGGTAPYTFEWTDGSTTEDLTGISASIYGVTVTDANNCTAILTDIIVDEMVNTQIPTIVEAIDLAPNPTSAEVLLNVRLHESAELTITILNNLGQEMTELRLGQQTAFQQSFNTTDWAEGVYFVQMIFDTNKVVTKRLVVVR